MSPKVQLNATRQGGNIYHLTESVTYRNWHYSKDAINGITVTESVSENILLKFDNSKLLLYMGLPVATKIEKKKEGKNQHTREGIFMFSCVHLMSHIVFLTVTQCHRAVGIERSWFNQHKTSKQVLIIYITWDKHLQN